jgi:AcrR family transcriptional regulator
MAKQNRKSVLDRRKKPSQQRSVATVDSIIEAAARILESQGHASLSTNSVAQRAGISIGSLYQYFPNKASIIRALIDREAERLLEGIRRAQDDDWKVMLDQLIEVAVHHQLRRPALARALDLEEARLPASRKFRSAGIQTIRQFQQCLSMVDGITHQELPVILADVLSIIRAIKDAAGQLPGDSEAAIYGRVRRAVHGYLSYAER